MTNFERCAYGLLALWLIFLMAGCESGRAIYHACKGGLCR